MHCNHCGAELAEGVKFCAACGQPVENREDPQAHPSGAFEVPRPPVAYAGFWLRAVAYLLDSILLGFTVGIFVLRPLMERAGISSDNPWVLFTGSSRQIVAINLLVTMAGWLYWALLESSPWQATLGKKALGLYVTDLAGKRVSFARASGRHFGKIIFIGFILAGFTPKKQALHDMMAGCLVLKRTT